MASKIEGKHFNVSIKAYEYAGQKFDTLRVSTTYRKGYGFSAYYTPGWNTGYGFGCILMGSGDPLESTQWVDIQQADKNSQKTINEMGAALELAKDVIRALFDRREWEMLNNVIHNVAKCGYTDSFRAQAEKYLNENKTDESINPKNEEEKIMANETLKPAELIGKKIMVKGTANYFVVLSAEGESLSMEFHMGNQAPKVLPMKWAAVQDFFTKGVYVLEGTEEPKATTATDDVEEVSDVQPTKPEPKVEEPKAEEKPKVKTTKPKAEKPKAEPKPKADAPKGGKYTYEEYITSKGKTGAKILGVSESDAVYQQAAAIHASGSYTKDADGNKHFYLCFGPRYTKAAESICKVLNSAKSEEQKLEECKLIVTQATEERAQQREEYKAKREERKAAAESEKTYTAKEVEQVVRKAFGALADAMKEDVAQFEPIIKAALPQAA